MKRQEIYEDEFKKARLTPTHTTTRHEDSLPDPVSSCIKKLGEELDKNRFINEECGKGIGYDIPGEKEDDPFRSFLRGLKEIIDKALSR